MTLNLNLRGKLIAVITIGIVCAFIVFGSFRIHMAKKAMLAEMNRSDQERVTLIAETLAPIIATSGHRYLDAVVDRIVDERDVQQVSILDRDGNLVLSRNNKAYTPDAEVLSFSAPLSFSGVDVGSIRILVSVERLNNSLRLEYRNILTIFPFFLTLFGVLIYTAATVFIVKPLTRLSKAAEQFAHGDYSATLPPATKDELGNLVRAFSTIREYRQIAETELHRLNSGLETLVKKRVSELHDKDAYVHAVLDNVSEGIIVIGEAGVIVSFNLAAEKIFGYAAQEIIGQNFSQLISQETVDLSGKYHKYSEEKAKEALMGVTREAIGLRKDLSAFPLELKTSQIMVQNKTLFITTARDISERKDAEQRISYMASHDGLTNLPNRTLLQDRIQQALSRNRRRNLMSAVLFIDLDKFKVINDTLGHTVGDYLLKEAAQRLLSHVRSEDTVARQGGDEFIILLSTISQPQDAGAIAQKLLDSLARPFIIEGHELHISASIGISIFPDDGDEMDVLLQNSDVAMYHAKDTGRSNFQFFSEKMNEQAAERQALGNELRHAISRKELFLVYQPVVDMADGTITGMEVLLRWQHPVRGFVSPVKFIPLAEENGLILPIGEWVFRTACQQLREWQQQGYAVPRLAINLSAKQFRQASLVDDITAILQETGIDSHQIGIEITESMLVQNVDEVVITLLKLSNMGLEISIDDFGTGYSSLSYLKRFPINKLKIDKTFVDDIATHEDDAAIVKAIIAMAHGLQMKVVSEGVETSGQLEFLRLHGCEQYQGYIFSKPLPASEIVSKLPRK